MERDDPFYQRLLHYADPARDRAGAKRRDAAWIAEMLARPETRVHPVWRLQLRIDPDAAPRAGPRAAALGGDAARHLLAQAEAPVFLGLVDGIADFAADLSALDEAAAAALAGGAFSDLRPWGGAMGVGEAAVLAHARAMAYWHGQHRFCGSCGAATASAMGGHVRRCTDDACGREHFPRTDPAVIMLVTSKDGNEALMGRSPRFRNGMYSTLAGFLEPGESLEQTVAREVFEESGIRVGHVRYMASQPWPFPASLMVGFRAIAETREISFDADELDDCRWFTRLDVVNFADRGFRVPPEDSIARWLIDGWLKDE